MSVAFIWPHLSLGFALKYFLFLKSTFTPPALQETTGMYHAAVLTNCENSQAAMQKAGRTSRDLTFPIPYTPELHFEEFDSASFRHEKLSYDKLLGRDGILTNAGALETSQN